MNEKPATLGQRLVSAIWLYTSIAFFNNSFAQTEFQLIPNYLLNGEYEFGYSVAISGDWAVVGAPHHHIYEGPNPGLVSIFK